MLFSLPKHPPGARALLRREQWQFKDSGLQLMFGRGDFSPFRSYQINRLSALWQGGACLRSSSGSCGFLSQTESQTVIFHSWLKRNTQTPSSSQDIVELRTKSEKWKSYAGSGWKGNEGLTGCWALGRVLGNRLGQRVQWAHLKAHSQGPSPAHLNHNSSVSVHWGGGVGGEAEDVREDIEEDPKKDTQMQMM